MAIVVRNLSKEYNDQRVVNNISFEVATGEVMGFLGPNGAGKSTTLKIITCFIAPSGGDVKLDGLSIHTDPEGIKRKIGYLPENNPLYVDMPIIDYLRFTAEIQEVARRDIPSRIGEMIELTGLDKEKYKNIGELSKGYRQRVGLAQSMIHDPEVLIFDEPTSGLDPNQIAEIRKLIKQLGEKKTVMLSSHILSEVEATCDRMVIINRGRIVADATPEKLREKTKGRETLNVGVVGGTSEEVTKGLVAISTIDSVQEVSGSPGKYLVQSKPGQSSRKSVYDCCVKNNWDLAELSSYETSLEDVFRDLTQ